MKLFVDLFKTSHNFDQKPRVGGIISMNRQKNREFGFFQVVGHPVRLHEAVNPETKGNRNMPGHTVSRNQGEVGWL